MSTTETPQDDTTSVAGTETPENAQNASEAATEADSDTFDRAYVENLRAESADHRTKARDAQDRAEAVSRELFAAKVAAAGRLADPTDLPYSAEALADPEVLNQQIDDLLASKPHFASRTPVGNVGIGVKDSGNPADGSGWLASLKTMV